MPVILLIFTPLICWIFYLSFRILQDANQVIKRNEKMNEYAKWSSQQLDEKSDRDYIGVTGYTNGNSDNRNGNDGTSGSSSRIGNDGSSDSSNDNDNNTSLTMAAVTAATSAATSAANISIASF